MAERVTRLLYGEGNDVCHDTDCQEEETFHDTRETQACVTRAIERNVSTWEILSNDTEGPTVYLDRTQDEVRHVVSETCGQKKCTRFLSVRW